jgi:hypothetical protein
MFVGKEEIKLLEGSAGGWSYYIEIETPEIQWIGIKRIRREEGYREAIEMIKEWIMEEEIGVCYLDFYSDDIY